MRSTLRRLLSTLGAVALVTTFFTASPGASAEAADTAYPTLNGVTMKATTVTAGSSITAIIDATDDIGITYATLHFVSAESTVEYAQSRAWKGDGTFSFSMPSNAANGAYRLDRVVLRDASGKWAYYMAEGNRLMLDPGGTASTHNIDLGATTFTVTGGADGTPPSLTTVSMPTRPAYEDVSGRLDVAVNESGPVKVTAVWTAPLGGTQSEVAGAEGGHGQVEFRLSGAGVHPLAYIEVADPLGNVRRYDRDGTVKWGHSTGTHTLNLALFDVTVKPAAPSTSPSPHPQSVRVLLSATEDDAKSLSGWRVVVNPGNIVREVPIKAGETQVDVGGLANGTAYTVSVIARSAVGDSKPTVKSARPMQSTNVFAVADASGDKRVDIIARQPRTAASEGASYVYPTNGLGAFGKKFAAFQAGELYCERIAPADIYIVGDSEVLCFGPDLVAKEAAGGGSQIGTSGWSSMRFVDGGQDLTGDGWADIVGVTPEGILKIYQTGSESRIVSTTTLGSGWNAFTALFQVGDFSGDRRADLVAVDAAGRMWLYPGNGRGGFGARVGIGSGWGGFGAVLPLRDFNGDGRVDVGAITTDGKLLLYPGNGRSGFLAAKTIGTGWGAFL